ncbi:TPA: DUF480 domain-containing protein, partial [Vibrio vulnificus]|nr:DUF480 domain-containing protein [Vibrio vulnificus]
SAQEKGIVCCMLLRGPQTPGELRTRTNRLATFADVKEVESALDKLASEERGQLVVKLPIEPGKRESRYMHQFCGEVDLDAFQGSALMTPSSTAQFDDERVAHLEAEVEALKQELAELKSLVNSLL